MAKKKPKVTVTKTVETREAAADDDGEELLETGGAAGDAADIDPLAELRNLLGDEDIRWTVTKISGKPGEKGGYCETYAGGTLSLDLIRENFGGGRYRIRGHYTAGGFAKQSTVDIMEPIKPAAATTAAPGTGTLTELAKILQDAKPASGGENKDLILALIVQQGEVMKAIAARPQQQISLADILAIIKATETKDTGKSTVDALLQGLSLGREFGGGGEPDPLSLGGKAIDLLNKAMDRKPEAAAKPAIAAPPAPGPALAAQRPMPAEAPTNGAGKPAEADPMLQKLEWLKAQVDSLVFQAARNRDPELYAAVMLDNLPEYVTEEEIQQRLAAPNAIDQLVQIDGRVRNFEPWFQDFRQAVLAILAEEPEAEPAPPVATIPKAQPPARTHNEHGDPLPDGTGSGGGGVEMP